MTPDTQMVMNDPWWLVLLKCLAIFVLLLVWTIFNVWYERRLVAKMQNRLGPIMNGPGGILQAVADGTKLLIKEDFMPHMVDRVLFTLAPIITGTAAFTAWAVMPLGGEVEIFGVKTRLQGTDLPVSTLVILAVASVGIYGFVLAGWSSNSTYSLLGALRSSAQMISYEISMGLSLVAVFLYAGSMSTWQIVEAQGQSFPLFGLNLGIQNWYWFQLIPSFVIYVISMVGETNRAPFDLPECESELVSGYITEYSGFRYAAYFLAEYINMATVSAVATTLFLGGYHAPWPFNLIPMLDQGWMGLLWFFLKVQLLISFFVWLRGTLPRFRYDQFMDLGWKWLIPLSLGWLVIVSILRATRGPGQRLATPIAWSLVAGLLLIGFGAWYWWDVRRERQAEELAEARQQTGTFDAFAGGFPVPPPLGEKLPELVEVVSASTVEEGES